MFLLGHDRLRATQRRPPPHADSPKTGPPFSSQIVVDQNGSRRLESRMNLRLVDQYNRKQEGEKWDVEAQSQSRRPDAASRSLRCPTRHRLQSSTAAIGSVFSECMPPGMMDAAHAMPLPSATDDKPLTCGCR